MFQFQSKLAFLLLIIELREIKINLAEFHVTIRCDVLEQFFHKNFVNSTFSNENQNKYKFN